jgi:hypothetical protein
MLDVAICNKLDFLVTALFWEIRSEFQLPRTSGQHPGRGTSLLFRLIRSRRIISHDCLTTLTGDSAGQSVYITAFFCSKFLHSFRLCFLIIFSAA